MKFRTTLIGPEPLHIKFDNIDRFIRAYHGTKYLVLFGPKKYDAIYNRIRYLISQKSGIIYIFFITMQKSKLFHMIIYA